MTRKEALAEMENKPWETQQAKEDKEYVLKKLDMTESWFDNWIKEKEVSHFAYPSYLTRHEKIVKRLKKLIGR